jgi:hypothetical protein
MKADPRLNVCTCGTAHTDTANSHVMRCSSNTSGWYHVHNKTVYALANIARAAGLSAYTRDFTKEKEEHHVVPDAVIMGGGQRRLMWQDPWPASRARRLHERKHTIHHGPKFDSVVSSELLCATLTERPCSCR